MLAPSKMGRPFMGPPEIPADRAAALRAAFDASMANASFREEAAKQRLEIAPLTGAEMLALVSRLYQSPTAVVERARALVHAPQ